MRRSARRCFTGASISNTSARSLLHCSPGRTCRVAASVRPQSSVTVGFREGGPIMCRLVAGLALIALMACGSVSAGEVQPSGSDGPQTAHRQPSSVHKRTPGKQSRSAPASLPLSSAETYTAEHRGNLSVSSSALPPALSPSAPRPSAPATNSWTGFYLGGGGGVGRD